MSWTLVILSSALLSCAQAYQLLPPLNFSLSDTSLDLSNIINPPTIYIESSFASVRDSEGLTLIPPSAYDFAEIFCTDLQVITGSNWTVEQVDTLPSTGILLGAFRGNSSELAYENGIATEEGYEIDVQNGSIFVGGTGARGMWWGTRTLLQQALFSTNQSSAFLPLGQTVDAPAYATRGFMLDAGRKWYDLSFLKDLCTYASFFKVSEFHYHSADNFPLNRGHNETWNEVYSQFSMRPENPDLSALVQRPNETLSPDELEDFQQHCARRGITVIPEIEAPGHALSITKWKPELALSPKDLMNLSQPESLPLVESIWSDFLPRLHSKEVHIGADEYDAKLADDYINFVNQMADFVNTTSGKRVRVWGTYEPSPTNLSISEDVIIQHWQYGQSDPLELTAAGYDIINSDDKWAYMSLKNDHVPISPAPYPQFFNETRVLNFAGRQGVQWNPQYVNSVNFSEQLSSNDRRNKGAILAAWNDNGPDASTQLEAYYAIRRGIPLVAAKAWTGSRGLPVQEAQIDETVDYLSPRVPGANLDRVIMPQEGTSDTLISYSSRSSSNSPSSNADIVQLGHGSKGMNYTLSLTVTGAFNLSSKDVSLTLSPPTDMSNTNATLTFTTSDNFPYPLRSTSYNDSSFFPLSPGQGRIWGKPPGNVTTSSHEIVTLSAPSISNPLNITITTDVLRGSRCWLNGNFAGRFEVLVFGGRNVYESWSQMAFVAPVDELSGGGVTALQLRDGVHEPDPVRDFGEADGTSSNSTVQQGGVARLTADADIRSHGILMAALCILLTSQFF